MDIDGIISDRAITINGYLIIGGGACPEQYDVFKGGKKIAYLRLRHGEFRAEVDKEIVFRAKPKGDGIFEKNERMHFLKNAIEAINGATK